MPIPPYTKPLPRKDQIQAAAERLFREQGYLATSVRDIGKAVGVQGASLYHHIGGKEDLLWSIASRAGDEFFAALQPVLESPAATPVKLRQAMIAHVGVIARNLDAATIYFNEWRHLNGDRREQYVRRRDTYEEHFREMLRQGVQEGRFHFPDEKFAGRFVLSALNWTHQWYHPAGVMTAEQVGAALADLILGGLQQGVPADNVIPPAV